MMKKVIRQLLRIELLAVILLLIAAVIMLFPKFFYEDQNKEIGIYTKQIVKMLKLAQIISNQYSHTVYAVFQIDDFGKGNIILTDDVSNQNCINHLNCKINEKVYVIRLKGLKDRVEIKTDSIDALYVSFPNAKHDQLMELSYNNHKIIIYESTSSGGIAACSDSMKGVFIPCGYTVVNKRV